MASLNVGILVNVLVLTIKFFVVGTVGGVVGSSGELSGVSLDIHSFLTDFAAVSLCVTLFVALTVI